MKTKKSSDLLSAIHETASGLFRHGLIDKKTMRQFDTSCLGTVPDYDSLRVRKLRGTLKLSQPVFAAVLNTSVSTVRKWESGDKRPSGPSLKLLHLLETKGIEVML